MGCEKWFHTDCIEKLIDYEDIKEKCKEESFHFVCEFCVLK